MTEFVVVYVTAANRQEAETISRALLNHRLAACANVALDVESIFHWQGNVVAEKEVLIMFKTRAEHFPRIVDMVKQHHSYEVPEIIALPILLGSDSYTKWIKEETEPLTTT